MQVTDRQLHKIENSQTRYMVVPKKMSDNAIEILRDRIANGEDPFEILKIDKKYSSYVTKIIQGLIILDDTLYYRITGDNPYIEHYDEITSEVDKENDVDEM